MGEDRLAARFNLPKKRSHEIIDHYLTVFSRMRPYMNEMIELCNKNGFVRTWSSRIWRETDVKRTYRAVNALVQGGAADIFAVAACRIQNYLQAQNRGSLVSFIHDELLCEVLLEKVAETTTAVTHLQEVEDLFGVPFLIDSKLGYSYGSMVSSVEWQA